METGHFEISTETLDKKTCRICFESSLPLISPCKCSGSVSSVHAVCLKTWISSQYFNLEDSSCEVCKTKYAMDLSFSKKLSCNTTKLKLLNTLCFLAIFHAFISLVMYFLVSSYDTDSTNTTKIVIIFLICLCVCTSFLGIIIFLFSTKQLVYKDTIHTWEIKNRASRYNSRVVPNINF